MTRFALPAALLALAFSACSNPIFGVGISDVVLSVPLAATTGGQVIYGAQSEFNKPTFAYTSVKLRGNSSQQAAALGTLRVNLYARKDAPACAVSCSANSQAAFKLNTAPLELKAGGAKTAFVLDDQNNALRDALNAGTMYLGVEVLSGATANATVTLSDLVADVTIL